MEDYMMTDKGAMKKRQTSRTERKRDLLKIMNDREQAVEGRAAQPQQAVMDERQDRCTT